MEKVIDITAKREGFRRAGLVHSETTKTYPLSDFTKAQLEQLQKEPMLVVAIRNSDEQQAGPAEDSPLVLELRKTLATLTEKLEEANGLLTTELQKNGELTTELEGEQAKNKSLLDMHEDYRTEATTQLEAERQKTSELTTELEGERQKVTDLTAKLDAATKKGK